MQEQYWIVCLVSNETIQNIIFIKEIIKIQGNNYKLLFVNTHAMSEKHKVEDMLKSLGLTQAAVVEISVLEHELGDCVSKLSEQYETGSRYFVNITGGTKLMSLAAYNFFSTKENCSLFYVPLTRDIHSITALNAGQNNIEISTELTVTEYLRAYGLVIQNSGKQFIKEYEFNKTFEQNIHTKYHDLIRELRQLKNSDQRIKKDKAKMYEYLQSLANETIKKKLAKLCADCGFSSSEFSLKHIEYLSGGWFEEFVAQKVMQELHSTLAAGQLAYNVQIKSLTGVSNELDVIYMKNNKLYVIECKSFIDDGSSLITETIYKSQALRSNFGLSVQMAIYTRSSIEKPSARTRAQDFNISIVDSTHSFWN